MLDERRHKLLQPLGVCSHNISHNIRLCGKLELKAQTLLHRAKNRVEINRAGRASLPPCEGQQMTRQSTHALRSVQDLLHVSTQRTIRRKAVQQLFAVPRHNHEHVVQIVTGHSEELLNSLRCAPSQS